MERRLTRRKTGWRPQYRLRLSEGRCLTYYETGQHGEKSRRGDIILAIYGNLDDARRWCERYNKEFSHIGLHATVWAYLGTKPLFEVQDDHDESQILLLTRPK